jgi:hypothetical protein
MRDTSACKTRAHCRENRRSSACPAAAKRERNHDESRRFFSAASGSRPEETSESSGPMADEAAPDLVVAAWSLPEAQLLNRAVAGVNGSAEWCQRSGQMLDQFDESERDTGANAKAHP